MTRMVFLPPLTSGCEFGDQEERLVIDRLVLGIREKSLLERLLREADLTLKKAADFLRSAETKELISKLEDKVIFSVLDLKDGFWQLKLDEESADLCTFNTPFGRENEQEHNLTLVKVLTRAKKWNVKFNPDKFPFKVLEVKYVGQIISNKGAKADPQHIKAVTKRETPTDKAASRE
ncbi:retrovirus-related Pol polyprotein from transposon 17.6 [Nephila pilipes]|uniref:Retrovirus-related Pol polyprotein from transposon 17.6 n=1 Tax=Nephila pilipes TaxID=299642 RepID=A0A8X6JVF7_NEPPI|nr:retrovirus-related Pol polyprotein from transposon 17.6 [Nephila pilipes]